MRPISTTNGQLGSLDFQSSINLLKVTRPNSRVTTVLSTMRACGLSGYRNDGDFTVGRHLRDVLFGTLMINNDRILTNIANGKSHERRTFEPA